MCCLKNVIRCLTRLKVDELLRRLVEFNQLVIESLVKKEIALITPAEIDDMQVRYSFNHYSSIVIQESENMGEAAEISIKVILKRLALDAMFAKV